MASGEHEGEAWVSQSQRPHQLKGHPEARFHSPAPPRRGLPIPRSHSWPHSLVEAPTLCSKDSGPTDFTLPELLPTPTVPLGPLSLGHSLPEEIPGWQEPTLPSGESRTRHVPAQPTRPSTCEPAPACLPAPALQQQGAPPHRGPRTSPALSPRTLRTCSRCLIPRQVDAPIQKPLLAAPGSVRGSPPGAPRARALQPHTSLPARPAPLPGRALAAECSSPVVEHMKQGASPCDVQFHRRAWAWPSWVPVDKPPAPGGVPDLPRAEQRNTNL